MFWIYFILFFFLFEVTIFQNNNKLIFKYFPHQLEVVSEEKSYKSRRRVFSTFQNYFKNNVWNEIQVITDAFE